MLQQMLSRIGVEELQATRDGSFHVNLDDRLNVVCSQNSKYTIFDGLILVLPHAPSCRESSLKYLLKRSFKLANKRSEALYVDSVNSAVRLKSRMSRDNAKIFELETCFREFVAGYDGWIDYVNQSAVGKEKQVSPVYGVKL